MLRKIICLVFGYHDFKRVENGRKYGYSRCIHCKAGRYEFLNHDHWSDE